MATNIGPITITLKCFHDTDYVYKYEIAKCVIKQVGDKFYHVIYLKKGIEDTPFKFLKSLDYHYIESSNMVDEVWEQVKNIPLSSIYSIESIINPILLNDIVTQMIQTICIVTLENCVYLQLIHQTPHMIKSFLRDNTSIIQKNNSYSYSHLYRITMRKLVKTSNKKLYTTLSIQMYNIITLIKLLHYQKLSSKESKYSTLNSCKNCKLLGYCSRFQNINHLDLHTLICRDKNINQLYAIGKIYKDAKNDLVTAIQHVESLL